MKKSSSVAIVELLERTEIFSSLLPHELEVIAESSCFSEYEENSSLFSPGDPGDCLYIVDSGEVVVQKLDESRQKIDIARFIRGNCFGELDLFSENRREAFATAVVASTLLVFPKPGLGFTGFLKAHPSISARVLHKLLVNIAVRIRKANALVKENSPLVQELRKQVYRDKLTGIYNQVFITEAVRGLTGKNKPGFSIIISKPDNFKALNDFYGHDAGDRAIRIMARRLRDFIGNDEMVARYKGNAMAVLLPETDTEAAVEKAREVKDFLNNLDVKEAADGDEFKITTSIGVASFPGHGEKAVELLALTHELPLEGRNRGGNMILTPDDSEAER